MDSELEVTESEEVIDHVSRMAAIPTLYCLASLSQVENTPSSQDGIPQGLEEDLRAYGCKLIQQAGILLDQYDAVSSSHNRKLTSPRILGNK